MSLDTQLDELIDTYKSFLRTVLAALSPDATQEQRDTVRNAIEQFLKDE